MIRLSRLELPTTGLALESAFFPALVSLLATVAMSQSRADVEALFCLKSFKHDAPSDSIEDVFVFLKGLKNTSDIGVRIFVFLVHHVAGILLLVSSADWLDSLMADFSLDAHETNGSDKTTSLQDSLHLLQVVWLTSEMMLPPSNKTDSRIICALQNIMEAVIHVSLKRDAAFAFWNTVWTDYKPIGASFGPFFALAGVPVCIVKKAIAPVTPAATNKLGLAKKPTSTVKKPTQRPAASASPIIETLVIVPISEDSVVQAVRDDHSDLEMTQVAAVLDVPISLTKGKRSVTIKPKKVVEAVDCVVEKMPVKRGRSQSAALVGKKRKLLAESGIIDV
ncbi:hypothetical protein BDR26DRAFT_920769 [Obelidium mucronatum]|nr:hypothetical protein BDR26DRAFT_920769 [Obelidium mucronatum]